ncbi:MAG: phenylalanine--tRNA ligase beta subunit-related protein, partial [Cloacibacillus evryensis]
IKDAERCSRYVGLVIKNISSVPSPFELKSLIWRVGMRPINLPVDITNYVMLATGQPTHGFDKKHIAGGIYVRRAYEGEKLQLLDGETLDLTTEDLVIADEKSPVGLAGVMGGKLDSILDDTTELILEVASFDALGIRRTSQRFDVRTEASARYEKSIDPQRVDAAVAIAAEAFGKYFPEMRITAHTDVYPRPLENAKVEVSLTSCVSASAKSLPRARWWISFRRSASKRNGWRQACRSAFMAFTGDISLPDDILEGSRALWI